ncbi:lysophospholipase [Tsuneonella deserti]|uniref:Lysophospholipase n=1 Tax=Tsuneonella deserti TaxID=2035528 RepID=A0ABQ1S1P2_9SPHN|nr:alpha/beta hydrolase [Tsuneonella deserti]GGD88306.1 lysophospholipase [Tsuneonella deserti]
MEGCWLAPDGHPIRRIDLESRQAAARGSILFLPGRGDFYEKYLETLDHWVSQGWRVTASDWRGQAGSGRLGADAVTGHIADYSQWIDDLAALWKEWTASTPAPHVLAGHSMGGHLILRAVAEGRVQPDAVVLSAPMLGFAGALPGALMHPLARLMKALGDPRRPAWKWSEKPGEPPAARGLLLTHDADRYADELWWRAERPELVMGPGSWSWVERGYASMRALFAPGVLERVRTPTLILATTHDKLVSYRAIAAAAARMPGAELVTFGGEAAHEILREADPVRDRALGAIDRFLGHIAAGR